MSGAGPPPRPVLRARDLGFAWPDGSVALRRVELEIEPGSVVGLLGPNGSGKTTLLRLLATALRPTGGTLKHFPAGPEGSLAGVRRRLAAVLDRPPALEALSGRENATHLLALRGWGGVAAAAAADRWLDAFGLGAERRRPVATYSLGMRRKLALAEAFAARAELLLLDEPLIGLDPPARAALRRWLEEHAAAGGAAVVALHDAAFAGSACDRILFLHRGAVVADGSPAELVRRLGGETVFHVRATVHGRVPDPPRPLRLLGRTDGSLRIASPDGSAALPSACAWLIGSGIPVRELRVREPGLEDVYLTVTGEPLSTEAPPAADAGEGRSG